MHMPLRTPPIIVRPLACEASLAMAMSDSQTLQADTEPPQANVELLLANHEHSLTDLLSPGRDPKPPWIDFLTDHETF